MMNTMMPKIIKADNLKALRHIRHGFFTRQGGVSKGIYQSLNCGWNSGDDTAMTSRPIATSSLRNWAWSPAISSPRIKRIQKMR